MHGILDHLGHARRRGAQPLASHKELWSSTQRLLRECAEGQRERSGVKRPLPPSTLSHLLEAAQLCAMLTAVKVRCLAFTRVCCRGRCTALYVAVAA